VDMKTEEKQKCYLAQPTKDIIEIHKCPSCGINNATTELHNCELEEVINDINYYIYLV